ncbi:MAG TPA: alanyl-tRNA editing protein, partial [Roseiflexaceae bacterium]|nr:alanyl-tRNA editing protein [Roseiflexaceae bacterium]
MITERLYFADAYLTHFSARVVARAERAGRPAVALDQSAFYPEGGGQPADTGTLDDVAVLDVQVEDGLVWHMLREPLEAELVQGAIDWPRRFDHMQQHHGQHLLSAAFERLHGLRTVSFHLGASASTIDLDGAALEVEQAAAVEDLTNQVIWEDRPVLARFVSAEELAQLPLRKPPKVDGPVRVVSVPDFDHSACGGTHPRATGGVGLLHLRRWERRGDVIRVEFVCGDRALRDLRWKNAALGRLAIALSVGPEEVEAAVLRVREAEERARKRLEEAGEQLIAYEAQELITQAELVGIVRVVRRAYEGRGLEEVRGLAKAIAAGGCVALLGLRAEKTQLIFARAEGLNV